MTVKIGKIVNTHGINGDLRIRSNSDFKDERFSVGSELIIENKKYKISNYFTHKTFDIISLEGYTNINQVLQFKNKDVYAEEMANDDLAENEFLFKDLIGLEVINDGKTYGIVSEVIENPAHELLRVKDEKRNFLLPFNKYFVSDVDLESNTLTFNNLEGLVDED